MTRIALFLLSFALCGVASAQSTVALQELAAEQADILGAGAIGQAESPAHIAQVGATNVAAIEQIGDGHTVSLRQDAGSLATVFQMGDGHALFGLGGEGTAAIQEGSSVLLLTQTGMQNTVLMHQAGGAFARLVQSGLNNTITAMQSR